MRITDKVTQNIIRRLIKGQDYRVEVTTLIDAGFLQYTIDFFRRVANAKLNNQEITTDWYKKELLAPELSSDELLIHAGLNRKTVANMYNSARREIVLEATQEHYEALLELIESLIADYNDIDIILTIKFRGVSVDLTINESLIVINTLAVKRSALRGGLWSTAGKQVEKPLMKTLCMLFNVPQKHFTQTDTLKSLREVDFYLFGRDAAEIFKCEVKLMGQGNPESADAIYARGSRVFVANKLSDLNKGQLTREGIEWVELRSPQGYKRFLTVLDNLDIPGEDFDGDINVRLDEIFEVIFSD